MNEMERRKSLKTLGGMATAGIFCSDKLVSAASISKPIRLGLISDLHGGLATDARSRLEEFLREMESRECHALVQMGDFAYPNEKHQEYAQRFNEAHKETIHVIGNHEFDYGLTREDCFEAWGIEASYYRRDVEGLRVLVLDGNDKGSPLHRGGYPSFIGKTQQQWLERELSQADRPVLVLSHQPLAGRSAIDNAGELQSLLGAYREKVVVCLNGHSHLDSHLVVDGVHYLHINSASYYWVGGKTRMAYYTQPLYTTVSIDPDSATVSVEASQSEWRDKSPKELGYFESGNRPDELNVTPQIRQRELSTNAVLFD